MHPRSLVERVNRKIKRRADVVAIQAPQAAVAVLHNDGLPFYQEFDLPIKAVLTETSYVKRLDENVVNGSCRIG